MSYSKKDQLYSLYDVGSFFIHLYDKIDGAYYCSQLKLEKLILLASQEYYKRTNQKLVFDMKTYESEDFGLLIDTSKTYFRTPISCSKVVKNEPIKEWSKEDLKKYKKSSVFHFDESNLEDEEKNDCMIDVFLKYGSYGTRTLKEIVDKSIENTINRLEAFDFEKTYNELSKDEYIEGMKSYLNNLIDLAQTNPELAKEMANKAFIDQGLVEAGIIKEEQQPELVKKPKKDSKK